MKAAVVANGDITDRRWFLEQLADFDLIIVADGGSRHFRDTDRHPHVVIGDMDSIDPATLAQWGRQGVETLRHPARKDQIDLELALDLAVARGAVDVDIFGAIGGRWDMSLANTLIMVQSRYTHLTLRIVGPNVCIGLVRPETPVAFNGSVGDTVSLIPLGSEVQGICTKGLEYALEDEGLPFGTTRGLSNTIQTPPVRIALRKGTLLHFHYRQPSNTQPTADTIKKGATR